LFEPQNAILYPSNANTDTPLPQEEPAGQNPPDGAIVNYYLGTRPSGPVALEIYDQDEKLVRRYSSDDVPQAIDPKTLPFPEYWVRPPKSLSAERGSHRWVWDFHHAPKPEAKPDFSIAAIYGETPPTPTGPRATPGKYTVRLLVDGKTLSQSLTLLPDPRVPTEK
jgi:hypothetical protein